MNKTVNNFTRILYEHDKLGQLSSYDKIPLPHTITCYAKDPLQSHSQMTHLDSSSMSPTTSAGTRNRPLLPHFEHLLASLQVRKLIFILIPLIGWIIFFLHYFMFILQHSISPFIFLTIYSEISVLQPALNCCCLIVFIWVWNFIPLHLHHPQKLSIFFTISFSELL